MNYIFILALFITASFTSAVDLPGNVNTVMINSDITYKYSIVGDTINMQVILTNNGAIGIGIGGSQMVGIDVAHLWWDNSKVNIADRSYINPTSTGVVALDTDRSGSSDFTDLGSTFDSSTGKWIATFKRKLTTGDQYDIAVTDGGSTQIAVAKFASQTWGQQHSSAVYKTVTLTSQLQSTSLLIQAAFVLLGLIALF